ncbi:MAG: S4 domain-containing protein, partial [Patescibacteria group bacterium]
MSIGDDAIVNCFTLLTDTPSEEIQEMQKKMDDGENPMLFKKRLAFELTKQLNSEEDAKQAQSAFEQTFQDRQAPTSMPEFTTKQSEWNPVDLLVASKLVSSKSDAKRLLEQGAVEINGKAISHQLSTISIKNSDILKVGKKKFLKIII